MMVKKYVKTNKLVRQNQAEPLKNKEVKGLIYVVPILNIYE